MMYNLYHNIQTRNMSTSEYLEKIMTQVEIMKVCGGTAGYSEEMANNYLEDDGLTFITATVEQINTATNRANET